LRATHPLTKLAPAIRLPGKMRYNISAIAC